MSGQVFSSEPLIRLGCFLGVLTGLALCEFLFPKRPHTLRRAKRWPGNLGVAFIDTLVVRLILPAGAVGVAVYAGGQGWGVLHVATVPSWLKVALSVVALDLIIYGQHWVFHYQPVLWRLHRMHHADLDVDVTTGARFHPVEIIISVLIKSGAIIGLGAPPLGVLIFEVLLNATSMFNHSNIRIPTAIEGWLRSMIVTPDMHRVHHSILARETNSNFGFNLSIWDRIFRTYRAQPSAGHEGMTLGLGAFRDPKELRLDRMLTQPLRKAAQTGATEIR